MEDVSFVGDRFLLGAITQLQAMKSAAKIERKLIPYMYEQFNVIFAYVNQTSYVRSTAARALNAMTATFNRKNKLPTYILFMLDRDLLENIGYLEHGVSHVIKKILGWLTREVNHTINARISDLIRKNPGTVRSTPYVIWIQMFQRPEAQNCLGDYYNRHRPDFNDMLLNLISKYRDHRMIEITSLEKHHFNDQGDLNAQGYEKTWKEVDFRLKQFDRGDIDLRPDRFTSNGKFVGDRKY